jgi:thiopurine S-methyltransferase
VFVPLCGKSHDLLWFAREGHRAVGVELSEIAVRAFFAEAGLAPAVEERERFRRYAFEEIEIFCGDYFDLTPDLLGPIEAVYDRAALIAFPPHMRARYARQTAQPVPAHTRMLLVTMQYPNGELAGPPFSVDESEVRTLYEPAFEIEPLASADRLEANPPLRERGLTRLIESVYALRRR